MKKDRFGEPEVRGQPLHLGIIQAEDVGDDSERIATLAIAGKDPQHITMTWHDRENTPLGSRAVIDILGLDSLFAEMVTGLGLALLAGNAFAWWKHQRGSRPFEGEFRAGRVVFLLVVGLLMTAWGVASLIGQPDEAGAAIGTLW